MGLIENQHRGRQRLALRPSNWSKASDRRNDETRCERAECRIWPPARPTMQPPRVQKPIHNCPNTVSQVHHDGPTKVDGSVLCVVNPTLHCIMQQINSNEMTGRK